MFSTSHGVYLGNNYFFHLLQRPIDQASIWKKKKKMLLFVKHCLSIGDEIPPGCEIQQMDYQGDAFGLLQTRQFLSEGAVL